MSKPFPFNLDDIDFESVYAELSKIIEETQGYDPDPKALENELGRLVSIIEEISKLDFIDESGNRNLCAIILVFGDNNKITRADSTFYPNLNLT